MHTDTATIAALFTGYRQPYCTFRDLQRIRKAFAVLDALGPSSYLSVKFLSLSLSLLLSLSLSLSFSLLPPFPIVLAAAYWTASA